MPLEPPLAELEKSIANRLDVERLAEAGLLSRSQLYRAFYSATGHSVKEYIRKRRMSTALALIKHTDMTLKKIAAECGFSCEQALCKCVKDAIGQTPKQYKAGGGEYYFPAFDGEQGVPVSVASESIPPTLRLQYYDSCLKGIENRALAWLFAARPGYSGRIFGRKGAQKGPRLCYELYVESEEADQPAVSGTFAKTACPDMEEKIIAAWDYLYNGWLKTSMFVQADAPWFEEYVHTSGKVKRLQLYLPIQKKPGFHKIQLCQCGDMRFLAASRSGADAEKAASKAVMDALASQYPRLAQSARQFYVSSQGKTYTCGVALQAALDLTTGSGLQIITCPAGEYAVLEGDCCGESGAYASVLASWVNSMGMQAGNAPFAVYETDGSYDRQNIRVKVCQKIEK